MKKLILIAAVLLLAGCTNTPVPRWEVDRALQYCADKGGLFTVRAEGWNNYSSVRCVNGDKKVYNGPSPND